MRKASYLYRMMNITLALTLILSQIQPVFVMAEEGVSLSGILTKEEDNTSDETLTSDGSPESEESTVVEDQLESEESTVVEDQLESEESTVVEDQSESEESTVVENQPKSKEPSNIDIISKAKIAASIADNNISFRNENEPEVTAEWGNYGDIKTVTIKADFQGYTTDKKIEITFDKAVVLQTDPNKLVDGRQILSVDTTNYVDYNIQTSNAGTLTFKEGTIELEVADSIETVSFSILLTIDERLIDTTADQIITEDKAIVVNSFAQGNVINKSILDKIKVKDEMKGAVSASTKSTLFTNIDTAYTVKVSPAGFNTNAAQVDRFYKKIEVRTSIPYTLNGTRKIYADVSNYKSTIPGTITQVPGTFTVDNNTHEIIFTCENVYLSAIQIDFTVRFDESKFKDGDIVTFEDGGMKIRGALTKDGDPDIEKLSKVTATGTIVLVTDELVEVNTLDLPIYKDNNEFFHMVGGFNITNLGAASKAKTIRIDFPSGDDALVGAGTIRIILPAHTTSQEITAELWDKSDNKVYSVTRTITRNAGSNSTGYAMNLDTWKGFAGLAGKDDVYFKSIEYTVDSFSKGYNSGGPNRTVGQTGVYTVKYFAERDGTATEAGATMTITDPSTQQIVAQGTITPTFEDKGVVTAALISETEFRDTQDQVLQGNITSGEPFYLYTSTKLSTYQYYNATFLKNPIFRVKVPEGIDIDFTKTVFSFNNDFSTSLDFEVNESNPGTSKDGARIYTFKFKDDVILGGIKSNFTINDNPIYAKVYMTSQKSVSTLALNTQDIIFLDSESMTLNTGGSWHPHRLRDTNDVNENNSIYDFVFTTDTSKILTFTAPTWIDSSFSVGLNGNSLPSTSVDLKEYDDTFELKVNIENNVPWTVNKDSFKYYFPVPKEGVELASQFNPGVQEIDLSFKEANISPELKVLYSTDENAYMNPDGASYTEIQPSDLQAITMIKIVSQQDLVTHDKVEMKVVYEYEYDQQNFVYDASKQSLFAPYGWLSMSDGGSGVVSGYDMLSQIHVTLKPIISENPKDIVVNWHEAGSMSFKTEEAHRIKSIQWQKKSSASGTWEDIAGAEDYTLTLLNNQLNQNGELYRVVVTSTDGTVLYSSPARLTVLGFSVTIPKEITLDRTTGSSDYEVSLKAQVPEGQVLSVKPDNSFIMSDVFGKSDITATITQDVKEWETSELDPHMATTEVGNIQVSNLTAGEWSGIFNFTIGFENK